MKLRNVRLNLDKVPDELEITVNSKQVRYAVAKDVIEKLKPAMRRIDNGDSIANRIEKIINDKYGYTFESLATHSRSPFLLASKQFAMFFLHVDADMKAREVAAIFNCTLGCVTHNKASVYSQIETDPVFKAAVVEIRNRIK